MRDDTTVTTSDIARLARVSRAAVSNWRRRYPDFPKPTGGTPASPVFSLVQVEAWLREQGKIGDVPLEERAWQLLREAGDELELGTAIRKVGTFQRGGTRIEGLSDRTAAKQLEIDQGLVPLLRAVEELAGAWGAAEAFEFLVERYLEIQLPRPTLTSPQVAGLVAELLDPDTRSVLDPACGTGALLLAAHERAPGRLYGQERDGALAGLAETRLALRSVQAEIRSGDSLRRDAFIGVAVDSVVCDPPFNERHWGYEELTADPRWEYGLPPRMESELAWAQHALAHLNPGGLAIMLMPPAAAGRRSGRRMRTQLLRRGALKAVIALSSGHYLWLLRKPTGDRPVGLLMVDGADDAEIVRIWRDFQAGRDVDRPGVSRSVPIIDLLGEEVDVTPARYLSASAGQPAEQFFQTRERLAALLGRLSGLMPEVEPVNDVQELTVTTVAELARIGALTVYQAAARGETSGADAGRPLLTAEDVVQGREPTGLVVPTSSEADSMVTRGGDIVVTVISRRFAARVVRRGGALLGPHLSLIRVDPQALDPRFLAGVLHSTANVRSSALPSTSGRVDVRRASVPRLPLDEQRRYGEAFQSLEAFVSAARSSALLGEAMARLLADGIAEGDLRATGG
ncbi:N-6 DNA methylase [Actinoallomurus sp. CA-150999]|uniref:N-6 DNA methylase n=1 Tax=Actinoallomurus sp. CA-150999 TaxID=3239887 RepID=UPI003D94DCCA